MIKYMKINELKIDKEFLNLIPRPSEEDYDRLKKSLKERGFDPGMSRILITSDGTVIDGYTRLKAAKELGIETVPVEVRSFDSNEDKYEKEYARLQTKLFIIQINTNRRHLNIAQKAEIAIELERILAEKGKIKRMQNLKNRSEDKLLTDQERLEALKELEEIKRQKIASVGPTVKSQQTQILSTSLRKGSRDPFRKKARSAIETASEVVGIGSKTLQRAKKIKQVAEKHPEIKEEWEKAKKGQVGVKTVYRKAKLIEKEKKKDAFCKAPPIDNELLKLLKTLSSASIDLIITDKADYTTTKALIAEMKRVAKNDAHLYFIVYEASELLKIQQILEKEFIFSDILVWNMEKKRNGRSTAFILKVRGKEERKDLKYTDKIDGNKIVLAKKLFENSTVENEKIVIVNGSGEFAAVAHIMKRKHYGKKLSRESQSHLREILTEARRIVKNEAPPNKETLNLVHWFWTELRGLPEEEYKKQTSRFFASEGKAAKELLNRYGKEEVMHMAKRMMQDKFYRKNGTVAMLFSKWAVIKTSEPSNLTEENMIGGRESGLEEIRRNLKHITIKNV